MTSINFKVLGLTRLGFKTVGSALEPVIFRLLDLPGWEVGILLNQPPQMFMGDRVGLESRAGMLTTSTPHRLPDAPAQPVFICGILPGSAHLHI